MAWAVQGSTTWGTPRWREKSGPGRTERGPSVGGEGWGAERLKALHGRRL